MNSDVLLQVCVRSDEDSLRVLSYTLLWDQVRLIVSTSYFWYLRTQYEFDIDLANRPGDWKDVYYKLSKYVEVLQPVLEVVRANESKLVLSVLLELGYDPNRVGTIRALLATDNYQLLEVLLADDRTVISQPQVEFGAITESNPPLECIELILSDGRLNNEAVKTVIVERIGAGGAYGPLTKAIKLRLREVIRLLVTHSLFDEYQAQDIIAMGDVELVKLAYSEDLALDSSTLSQTTVAVVEFLESKRPSLFQGRGLVMLVIVYAIKNNNTQLARFLVGRDNVDINFLWLTCIRSNVNIASLVDLLFYDPRLNVATMNINSALLRHLEPIIGSRLVAAYRAGRVDVHKTSRELRLADCQL